jgi:hypothetical protein
MSVLLADLFQVKNVYSAFGSSAAVKKQCDKIIIGYGGIHDSYEIPSKAIMAELETALCGIMTPHTFSDKSDILIIRKYTSALTAYAEACPPPHPIHFIDYKDSPVNCVYTQAGHLHMIEYPLFEVLLFDLCLYRSNVIKF